jgi:2,3-bisphosphoglycerate-independent phosphoglycerate mutase
VLCILDGWGHRDICKNNAICMARTPVLDRLYETCPNALVDASEQEVGLPSSQMGNSEVGHMNLGAGRIVTQDLPRIGAAIANGELATNPALARFIAALKESGGTAHILGLLSPGGVHSHQDHIAELVRLVLAAGVPVAVHGFLDGRDTPPRAALGYLRAFQAEAPAKSPGPKSPGPKSPGAESPGVPFATITGRYYAMDRDQRWERNALAYRALVAGEGETAPDAAAAIEQSYAAETGDEFVKPTVLDAYAGMNDGDGLLMANFRADRARQILTALLDPDFNEFPRGRQVSFAAALGMVSYSTALDSLTEALFAPIELSHTLGEVVAEAGLRQLRIAETEKYAHVTFFLNGGREAEFPGEERVMVPSPRVATYDLKPEMSAFEMTDKLVAAIAGGRFDLIIVNYANADMVGHTGDLNAAIAAVEAVDACLGRLADAVGAASGALLITADHGNAEQMTDPVTGAAHTAHTTNKVPAILVNAPSWVAALDDGRLADVAPTLLALLNLPKPAQMTGHSLIQESHEPRAVALAAHAVAD